MENNTALPSENDGTDNFDPSSRKRKLRATDVEAKLGNQIPYELNQQRVPFSWTGGQRHTHQSWLNPNHSLESNTIRNQLQMDQLHRQNYSLEPQSTSNGYSYHSAISNHPSILSSQSPKRKGCSSLYQMPAGKTPEALNCAPDGYSVFSRSGTSALPSLTRSCNAPTENPHIAMDNLVKYGIKKHETPNVSSGIRKVSFESSRSVETEAISFPDGFNKRTCSGQERNIESACILRISHQDSMNAGFSNLPSELADNSRVSAVERGMLESLQNVLRGGSAEENSGTEEQGHKEGNNNFMKQTETSTEEDIKDSYIEDSVKDGRMSITRIGHAHSGKIITVSPKFLDKERSSPAKATSLVHEKLWEGSLQLNSSVTAFAVAFYKSGERLLDVNWSECVEVKGKVRLEAFEKYIQDLPRSRTRGLMVAKGYRKGERVGFAKLSPSVDIYLCPPSDKIITILAKYGFFKGLAAGEDKSELLLGCIVWRKNQMISGSREKKSVTSGAVEKNTETSGSVKKKSENNDSLSDQILKTPSDGSSQSMVERGSSSVSHELVNCSSALGIVNLDENKKIAVSKMSSSIEFLPTASVQTMVSISAREQKSEFSSTSKGFEQPLQETKTYWQQHPKMEKSKTSSELHKAVIPFPCTAIKPNMPVGDDDDLPEFDFKTACEIPLASVGMTLQPRGIQISDRLVVKTVNSVSLAIPKSSFDKMNKQKLFSHDDDDMPEWLPPKPQIQSSAEANKPSAMLHTANFNSTSRDPPQCPSGSVPPKLPSGPLPRQCSVPARPDYPSQGFPPFHHQPPNLRVPPPRPFQNGPRPRPSAGFTFIPALQPQSGSFESKHPPVPGNIRGWRPS
ncbi:uncharacterized protein LOC111407925 isoform X2 [Olea europaea var. sylvestris]|uniref:uncharacterized protein LOC111407925 isoform X2 n=1 Tax=Olea europaea var. sylvestris TaxID=158386 RepID=UPI000C1D7136|nr:uncharacterized protein LOC111407925 isoform X2 [Olea europaea var. sylvestris]